LADFVPFSAGFDPFSPLWYDGVVLLRNFVVLWIADTTDWEHVTTDSVRKYDIVSGCGKMGTIVARTRKDGSKAFTAQIVIKRGGAIVHREAETFDRKQAANAWIVKREGELKRPDGLERKEDPKLTVVIDRYVKESRNPVLGSKAQMLSAIKTSDLGETKCSEITANTLVSFARELTKNVESPPVP
jgi:hypothetical protein